MINLNEYNEISEVTLIGYNYGSHLRIIAKFSGLRHTVTTPEPRGCPLRGSMAPPGGSYRFTH